ncbi:IN2-1-like protein A [Nymphaea thermarum]|nr:IN2-1-like protein A [Nymphaea thermarum]
MENVAVVDVLYISLVCPYAQRVWIARNYKGLEAEIEVVPIDIRDKPQWYMEKVYQPGRVPCLEHNGKVMGESLDLLYYLDDYFTGPQLLPEVRKKLVGTDPGALQTASEITTCTAVLSSQDLLSLGGLLGWPVSEVNMDMRLCANWV